MNSFAEKRQGPTNLNAFGLITFQGIHSFFMSQSEHECPQWAMLFLPTYLKGDRGQNSSLQERAPWNWLGELGKSLVLLMKRPLHRAVLWIGGRAFRN